MDTLIRYQLANGEDDLKNLEKLTYTYERGAAGDEQLSSSEKTKRVQQMGEQRQKLAKVINQAK